LSKLLANEFATFCKACFGDVSDQQFIDLRRTFYGGASAVYFLLLARVSPGDEPTEADIDLMRGLQRELGAFVESVKAGKA
jgi:hypothetical protein